MTKTSTMARSWRPTPTTTLWTSEEPQGGERDVGSGWDMCTTGRMGSSCGCVRDSSRRITLNSSQLQGETRWRSPKVVIHSMIAIATEALGLTSAPAPAPPVADAGTGLGLGRAVLKPCRADDLVVAKEKPAEAPAAESDEPAEPAEPPPPPAPAEPAAPAAVVEEPDAPPAEEVAQPPPVAPAPEPKPVVAAPTSAVVSTAGIRSDTGPIQTLEAHVRSLETRLGLIESSVSSLKLQAHRQALKVGMQASSVLREMEDDRLPLTEEAVAFVHACACLSNRDSEEKAARGR